VETEGQGQAAMKVRPKKHYTRDELDREVHAWTEHRNDSITGVDGPFPSVQARTKLKRRYPEFTS